MGWWHYSCQPYYTRFLMVVVLALIYWKHGLSLQVIPERAMKTYSNEKYLYPNASINVRRYGRKSGYFINLEGTLKMEFGNNVSLNLIFFEFLHNEYKRSFVEMKFPKICDMINQDPYVGRAFKQIGLVCPLPALTLNLFDVWAYHNPDMLLGEMFKDNMAAKTHTISNISIPADDFPNVWPFERCKVEAALLQRKSGDVIATADIFILFKQKNKGKGN